MDTQSIHQATFANVNTHCKVDSEHWMLILSDKLSNPFFNIHIIKNVPRILGIVVGQSIHGFSIVTTNINFQKQYKFWIAFAKIGLPSDW